MAKIERANKYRSICARDAHSLLTSNDWLIFQLPHGPQGYIHGSVIIADYLLFRFDTAIIVPLEEPCNQEEREVNCYIYLVELHQDIIC